LVVKKFAVSLVVTSTSLMLDELSGLLDHPPSGGSHNKGAPDTRGTSWDETLWRLESAAGDSLTLDQHFENLEIQFPPKELVSRLPSNCKASIDVVVLFDTFTVSADLSRKAVAIANAYGASLGVTCYPTSFEET
jgi:hypothetical protein